MASSVVGTGRIDLNKPRYDQSTFSGRAKHFFIVTNPLNLFASSDELDKAKILVQQYRQKTEPAGTTEDQVWRAKQLYDSAFHPDTGEKQIVIGRMSAQVPMNMIITGCMLTFYKTTPTVIFWQWFNQSFNAVVNYTNRSGDSPISPQRLGFSYVAATTAATGTALGLNKLVAKMPPLVGRYVPFAAVAAANCINIPCMRSRELTFGIPVLTKDGQRVGESKTAAKQAIAQVVVSRIFMASPGMLLPPILMNSLEKGQFLKKYPWMNGVIQTAVCGAFLIFATPLCCAIFPQQSSIAVTSLEPELQQKLKSLGLNDTHLYYNKGL